PRHGRVPSLPSAPHRERRDTPGDRDPRMGGPRARLGSDRRRADAATGQDRRGDPEAHRVPDEGQRVARSRGVRRHGRGRDPVHGTPGDRRTRPGREGGRRRGAGGAARRRPDDQPAPGVHRMSTPNGTTALPERGTESVEALVGHEVVPEPTTAPAWTRDAAMAAKAAPLRIYLGSAPGVGKTFAMLSEGRRRAERG